MHPDAAVYRKVLLILSTSLAALQMDEPIFAITHFLQYADWGP
jgi:hypothetical protein